MKISKLKVPISEWEELDSTESIQVQNKFYSKTTNHTVSSHKCYFYQYAVV